MPNTDQDPSYEKEPARVYKLPITSGDFSHGKGDRAAFRSQGSQHDDAVENHEQSPHTSRMNTAFREEFGAKLEALEARLEGRVARIEDAVQSIKESIASTHGDMEGLRTELRSTRTTVVVTAIGATLTVLFGVAAFNATLTNNMVAALGSGKEVGAALEAARQQQAETASLLAEIRSERAAAQQPATR